MVAEVRRAPRVVREQTNFAAASAVILARLEQQRREARRAKMRAILKAIEPWCDWGRHDVSRLDAQEEDFSDESCGKVRFFEIQWLGLHFEMQFGRTPANVSTVEIAGRKASQATMEVR